MLIDHYGTIVKHYYNGRYYYVLRMRSLRHPHITVFRGFAGNRNHVTHGYRIAG